MNTTPLQRFCKFLLTGIVWAAAGQVWAASGQLNLFIWSEYIDPQLVKEFEGRYDCKVTVDLYEDEASMLAKLQGGGASLYDVIVPPGYSMPALIQLRLVQPLRHENIPNLKNLAPRFANPPYDPGNRYSVAYQWGTVGIYLRKAPGTTIEESWGLLFDPAKQPGSFLLLDSDRDLIGSALKYAGHSLNSVEVDHLKDVRKLLLEAKGRSLGFAGAVASKNRVLSKEAVAAICYSGDAVRGMQDDPETYYFVPREGSQIWVDNLAVTSRAPHRDLAETFLNYILDAKVGARLSEFNQFATPNAAAKPLIRAEDRSNPAIYPPEELMPKLEFLRDAGRARRLYDEIWTQVKSK